MSGTDSKRERILAAALDIFSTQGFANATVQEIAGRAKVGKGTVYTYFPAKEDILTYLLDEGLAHMGQHIGNRIRTVKGSATKLQAILREQLRYFHEHQSLCRPGKRGAMIMRRILWLKGFDPAISGCCRR